MPNPHGNPEIKKYAWKTDRPEPLTAKLTLRLPQSMMDKIKAIENYPEFCRQALAEALGKLEEADNSESESRD